MNDLERLDLLERRVAQLELQVRLLLLLQVRRALGEQKPAEGQTLGVNVAEAIQAQDLFGRN